MASAFVQLANHILGRSVSEAPKTGSSQAMVVRDTDTGKKITVSPNLASSYANAGNYKAAVNTAKLEAKRSNLKRTTKQVQDVMKVTPQPAPNPSDILIMDNGMSIRDDIINPQTTSINLPTAAAMAALGTGAASMAGVGMGGVTPQVISGFSKGVATMAGVNSLEAIGAGILGALGINYGAKAIEKSTGWNIPLLGYSGAELRAMKRKRKHGITLKYSEMKAIRSVNTKMKRFDKLFNMIGFDVQKKVRHVYEGGKRK